MQPPPGPPPPGPPPAQVLPGDPRTLGFGTDQGRFLSQSINQLNGQQGAPNPFRQQRPY